VALDIWTIDGEDFEEKAATCRGTANTKAVREKNRIRCIMFVFCY